MPRQASDDSTSVGRKCVRANVLFPDPEAPIRTTSDMFGILSSVTPEYRQLRGWTKRRVLRANSAEPDGVAEMLGGRRRPCLEFGARPLEAVVTMPKLAGWQVGPGRVELGIWRRQHDGV